MALKQTEQYGNIVLKAKIMNPFLALKQTEQYGNDAAAANSGKYIDGFKID